MTDLLLFVQVPPSSCGLVVIWLVQLETKIRNQATTKGKGSDPEFPATDTAQAHVLLHIWSPVCTPANSGQSPHTSHAYLETFMLI